MVKEKLIAFWEERKKQSQRFMKQTLLSLEIKREAVYRGAVIGVIIGLIAFLPAWLFGQELNYGNYLGRYLPLLEELRENIASEGFLWSWYPHFSETVAEIYPYYTITNPFSWIAVIFYNDYSLQRAGIVCCIKLLVGILAAIGFLSRMKHGKKGSRVLLWGTIGYTLAGIAAFFFFDFLFDILVILPPLLYGIDLLLKENKKLFYIGGILFAGVVNPYFWIPTLFCVLLYAFFAWLFQEERKLKSLLWLIVSTLLGISLLSRRGLQGTVFAALAALAVCMASAILYLHLFKQENGEKGRFVLIGAVVYTMLGAALIGTDYYFLLDVVSVFPLVLYGAEILIQKKKKFPLIGSLILLTLVNYYFFLPILLILLLYIMIRLKLYLPSGWKNEWRTFLWGLGCLLMGTAFFAVVLLPVLSILLHTEITLKLLTLFCLPGLICSFLLIGIRCFGLSMTPRSRKIFLKAASVCVAVFLVIGAAGYYIMQMDTNTLFASEDYRKYRSVVKTLDGSGEFEIRFDYPVDETAEHDFDNGNPLWDSLPDRFIEAAGIGTADYTLEDKGALYGLLDVKYYFTEEEDAATEVPEGFWYDYTLDGVNIFGTFYSAARTGGDTYDGYCLEEDLAELSPTERVKVMVSTLVIKKEDEKKISQWLPYVKPNVEEINWEDELYERFKSISGYPYAEVGDGFEVNINVLQEENVVFFLLPYDPDLKVTVEGEPAETFEVNYGFLGVYCPKGGYLTIIGEK